MNSSPQIQRTLISLLIGSIGKLCYLVEKMYRFKKETNKQTKKSCPVTWKTVCFQADILYGIDTGKSKAPPCHHNLYGSILGANFGLALFLLLLIKRKATGWHVTGCTCTKNGWHSLFLGSILQDTPQKWVLGVFQILVCRYNGQFLGDFVKHPSRSDFQKVFQMLVYRYNWPIFRKTFCEMPPTSHL